MFFFCLVLTLACFFICVMCVCSQCLKDFCRGSGTPRMEIEMCKSNPAYKLGVVLLPLDKEKTTVTCEQFRKCYNETESMRVIDFLNGKEIDESQVFVNKISMDANEYLRECNNTKLAEEEAKVAAEHQAEMEKEAINRMQKEASKSRDRK